MKTKLVVIIGVFILLITPFFSLVSFVKAQTTENSLIYGAINATPKSWDPATSQADLMGYIKDNAIEQLVWQDTKGDIHPELAESWTIHERPNGTSTAGPNNGGVAAIEFKLREGVTFHDGSEFNASVVKWNFDRLTYLSGYVDYQWNNIHWMNPAPYARRFIPTWDLSWAINDPEVSFIDTANWVSITDGDYINYTARYGVGAGEYVNYYIWFDLTGDNSTSDPAPTGRQAIYCNISSSISQQNVSKVLGTAINGMTGISASYTDVNVTITNAIDGDVPDITDHNSGLTVSTTADGIIRNPFKTVNPEYIPKIKSTDVISEFVVNVTMNTWYTDLTFFSGYHGIISKEAYRSWENITIPGYESVPNAPDGTPFPGHMIGTGPYMFESVDFVVESKVHSVKFENYWNKTALEAEGAFSVTDFYGRFYADATARGNALLATDIDLVNSMLQDPAPIADVIASPYLTYIPTVPDASVNVLSLLSAEAINTPLASLGDQTIREWFPTSTFCTDTLGLPSGTPYPEGLNKTVRKAASYAFDYQGYVAARYPATSGGGIYCWNPFGMSSPFTDESLPHPYLDLDIARNILLADPYYAAQCASKGLSLANSTAEWIAVANDDPIDTFTLLNYPGSPLTGFVEEAFNSLGFEVEVHLDISVSGELWTLMVATGRAAMYDMFPYVYLMNPLNPAQFGIYWYGSYAAKPPGWGYNYAHLMNGTVDNILANVEFLVDKQDSYNELADILINKEVHSLYQTQGTMGMVLNAGFTYTTWAPEVGGPAGPGIAIEGIGGSRIRASALPPIPGFPIGFMVLTMMVSMIGLIYFIKRKRN